MSGRVSHSSLYQQPSCTSLRFGVDTSASYPLPYHSHTSSAGIPFSKVTIIASVYHLFAKIITIFNIRKFAAGYSISAQNFAMPGVAEKAGSGTDKIIKEWKEAN